MSIHIANCTKQHLRFYARVPEQNKLTIINIPSGQQSVVGQAWGESQTKSVIEQMDKLGFIPAQETNRRPNNFSGVIYKLDKQVTEDQIHAGHEELVKAQQERSVKEAIRSVQAFDVATRDPKDKRRRLARVTEVSIKEDLPPRQSPTGNEVSFSLSVTPEGVSDTKIKI